MANKRDITVGAFVLLGIVMTAGVVITLGNERRAFDRKVEFQTSFDDVQGLKEGAPVRLSGVDIGKVKSIEHGSSPSDDRLYVKMQVVGSEAARIRTAIWPGPGSGVGRSAFSTRPSRPLVLVTS